MRAIESVREESCYKTDAVCAVGGRGERYVDLKVNQDGQCCYIIDLVLLSFAGSVTFPWQLSCQRRLEISGFV